MEAGHDRVRVVESRDTEIDRFGLVIDLHQERRPALVAELRWPKLDEGTDRTASAPLVQTRSPSGTLAKTIAGAPLYN